MSELRNLRIRALMTQKAAAAAIGVDQSQISRWENFGFPPVAERFETIANAYHCEIDDVISAITEIEVKREVRREQARLRKMRKEEAG